MITYCKGDATRPVAEDGLKIIAHVCNIQGGWGRGFVLALSARWPQPEAAYRAWYDSGENFFLGNTQFVRVEEGIVVCNMLAQKGYGRGNLSQHRTDEADTSIPLQYDALEECLRKLANRALATRATVHMPRIGTGLAGGSWDEVSALIEKHLRDVDVRVYDLV